MRVEQYFGDSQWRSLNGFVALVTSLQSSEPAGGCRVRPPSASDRQTEEVELYRGSPEPSQCQESREQCDDS